MAHTVKPSVAYCIIKWVNKKQEKKENITFGGAACYLKEQKEWTGKKKGQDKN